MKHHHTLLLFIILLVALVSSACGMGLMATPDNLTGEPDSFERPDPPEEYAGRSNSLASDPASVAKGQLLFVANCASCHGEFGLGDGVVSASLEPKPQNLAVTQKSLSDAYLYWRIAEGGALEPFRSAMPAWRSLLTETHIWQIIAFLRTFEG